MPLTVTRSGPRLTALVIALAMTLAACSIGSTAAPPAATSGGNAASPGAAGSAVTIQNFAFGPAALTVAVGTTVTWTNQDNAGHTVTANDGSFGSSTIANGQTFSQAFTKAGTYAYHCSIHSSMTATIVVQ